MGQGQTGADRNLAAERPQPGQSQDNSFPSTRSCIPQRSAWKNGIPGNSGVFSINLRTFHCRNLGTTGTVAKGSRPQQPLGMASVTMRPRCSFLCMEVTDRRYLLRGPRPELLQGCPELPSITVWSGAGASRSSRQCWAEPPSPGSEGDRGWGWEGA